MVAHIRARFDHEAEKVRRQWNSPRGTATRHCTIDTLLPEDVAANVYRAFPANGTGFEYRSTFRERKRTSYNLDTVPRILADVTYALQDPEVVSKISELTGLEGIEPDPHLYAGGLSMMFRGDFLNPHIDNSHDRDKDRYRRINLLYYVTPDWEVNNGGNLELWDDQVSSPVTICSSFNRLVLMETNRRSWHSVSPVKVADLPRCCVSSYYFSKNSPTGRDYYHVTSFTGRPGQIVRRTIGALDNAARTLARNLGARRRSDSGYEGELTRLS